MADPRSIDGAYSLLFEKLVDLDPKSSVDPQLFRVQGIDDLKASIKRELERLLDTRRPVTIEESVTSDPPGTVMEYGIPDWSTLAPSDVFGCDVFVRALREAILAYEPRLRNPKVKIAEFLTRFNKLTFVISGEVRLGTLVEPVSFPIDFSNTPAG